MKSSDIPPRLELEDEFILRSLGCFVEDLKTSKDVDEMIDKEACILSAYMNGKTVAALDHWKNVASPPPLESESSETEKLMAVAHPRLVVPSSFDEDDDEPEDDSEGWYYFGVKREELERTLTEMKLILECALSDDPSINLALLINPNGKGKTQPCCASSFPMALRIKWSLERVLRSCPRISNLPYIRNFDLPRSPVGSLLPSMIPRTDWEVPPEQLNTLSPCPRDKAMLIRSSRHHLDLLTLWPRNVKRGLSAPKTREESASFREFVTHGLRTGRFVSTYSWADAFGVTNFNIPES